MASTPQAVILKERGGTLERASEGRENGGIKLFVIFQNSSTRTLKIKGFRLQANRIFIGRTSCFYFEGKTNGHPLFSPSMPKAC